MPSMHAAVLDCAVGRAYYGAALTACPSVQVTAIVDPDARLARAWARELGRSPAAFASLDALLESATPLDAVLVTAPMRERAAVIVKIARAGKAIFSPVPFAPRLAETDAVLREAEANNVLLMPALPRRLDADFQQASRILAAEMGGTL